MFDNYRYVTDCSQVRFYGSDHEDDSENNDVTDYYLRLFADGKSNGRLNKTTLNVAFNHPDIPLSGALRLLKSLRNIFTDQGVDVFIVLTDTVDNQWYSYHTQDEGTIESFLKDNAAYATYSSPTDPGGGKWAATHFRTLQRGASHTLVELKLETGRKNQIRVHLQDIGHPVCGDHKYGGKDDDPAGRLCLHAYRLCLYHPITGEHLRFETPMPVAFERALR